jgi:hypothetical protein
MIKKILDITLFQFLGIIGTCLLGIFLAVLALHVLVMGGFTVYYLLHS